MLHKLRDARPGREGLHAHRAPGRHPDHRHPRRDRPAGVPQPARQGSGHRGQDQRPHRADRVRDATTRTTRTTRRRRAALRPSSRALRTPSAPRPLTAAGARPGYTVDRHLEGQRRHRVHDRRTTRRRTSPAPAPARQGRLPVRRQAGSQLQLIALCIVREAGLRARFVVNAPSSRGAAAADLSHVFRPRSVPPRPAWSASSSTRAISPPPRWPSTAPSPSTRGAVAPLRPGILRDGEVADAAGPRAGPQGPLRRARASQARARSGIANQRIVVRTLDLLPADDPKAPRRRSSRPRRRTTSRCR